MDEIDAALKMPEKAYPLREYARYYAQRPDGKIAIFLTANTYKGTPAADVGCSEILLNGTLREAPCGFPIEPKAGERRWVKTEDMPGAHDGGCTFINAVYNLAAHRIEELACNGPE